MTAHSQALTWRDDGALIEGVRQREFLVRGPRDDIPGLLWTPPAIEGRVPLVLLGHGGRRNRTYSAPIGRRLAARGLLSASIDAPDHGERGPVVEGDEEHYRAFWRNRGVERAVEDWHAVLDALLGMPEADASRVGWWGVSMGTMLGLPFVVDEPRIRAAVLGLCGFSGTSVDRSQIRPHLEAAAPRLDVPVMFLMMWDDERFERAGQVALYEALGSRDKRLLAYPGLHGEMPDEARDLSADFLAARL